MNTPDCKIMSIMSFEFVSKYLKIQSEKTQIKSLNDINKDIYFSNKTKIVAKSDVDFAQYVFRNMSVRTHCLKG